VNVLKMGESRWNLELKWILVCMCVIMLRDPEHEWGGAIEGGVAEFSVRAYFDSCPMAICPFFTSEHRKKSSSHRLSVEGQFVVQIIERAAGKTSHLILLHFCLNFKMAFRRDILHYSA